MTKLYPSILIGLGDSGADIVGQVAALVASYHQPELIALTRALVLDAGGLRGLGEASAADEAGSDGSPAGLETEVRAGVWAANYEALLAESRPMRQRLERAVHEVRGFTQGVGVERRSIELGSDVTVYLVSSLSEPVGSAALVPLLAMVHETFNQTFRGMHARVQLVLLAHDLLPEGPAASPLLKARAYVSLQELEWVFDGGLRLPYTVEAHLTWLLSSRNEENLFLGGHAQLVPVIAHQMLTMLRGEVLGDVSRLTTALGNRLVERATRYSAFGFSQLVFPREYLLARVTDALVARILVQAPALAGSRLEREALAGEVERFVYGHGLHQLLATLGKDESGNEIWTGYTPELRVLEEENAQTFLHELDRYDREFEEGAAPEMQRGIGNRKAALRDVQQAHILEYVKEEILARRERGTLLEAEAWLAALLGERSEWVQGEVSLGTETLYVVDRALDDYFEKLLFGDEQESPEYVARLRIARSRRRLLQQVKRQLDEKVGALEQRRQNQDVRQQQLDAAEGGGEAAAGWADGPDDAARPAERTTAATRLIITRAEMESDARYITALEGEIAPLTELYVQVHSEVTRLDHVIQTTSERRRIFLAKLEHHQEAIGKTRDTFVQADQTYRSLRAELADWADRRRSWLWMMVSAWVVGLVVEVGLLWRYPELRQLPWWGYAAILAAGAAFTGVLYWKKIGARYRELQEQTDRALKHRDGHRTAVVGAYGNLRHQIYDYDRYDALVNWRSELTDFVKALRADVHAFREELLALGRRSAEAAERLELPDSPFLEYLLPEGGVSGLLEAHVEAIELQTHEMWREKPVEAVFEEFRAAGGDRLEGFLRRVRARAETAFHDLHELTAEQYFAEAVPSEAERRARIGRLYRNAAPFAKRLTEEGGDTTARLDYVGFTDAQWQSVVRATLGAVESYSAPVKTEVSMLRLAMGFPAFQFAPMEEAHSNLENLSPEDRAGLYVDASWICELQELKPSSLRLGGADYEPRRLACLAVAYGCATLVETEQGPRVRYGRAEFPRYDAWILHLGSLAGTRDRRKLEEELREIGARSTTELLSPSEVLRAYRERNPWLDSVDREIIDTEIGSYVSES